METKPLIEIQNIRQFIEVGYEKIQHDLQQLRQDTYIPETKDERFNLLSDQYQASVGLSFSELQTHTFVHDVIKELNNELSKDNQKAKKPLLEATAKLRNEALRVIELCHTNLDYRIREREEIQQLDKLIRSLVELHYTIDSQDNPFATINIEDFSVFHKE